MRTRIDQAYEDKLDGKLDEQMWPRKMRDWRDQEMELEAALSRLETPCTVGSVLAAQRTLELAPLILCTLRAITANEANYSNPCF